MIMLFRVSLTQYNANAQSYYHLKYVLLSYLSSLSGNSANTNKHVIKDSKAYSPSFVPKKLSNVSIKVLCEGVKNRGHVLHMN